MPTKKIVDEHDASMVKTVEHLQNDLRSIRTARASTGLVDGLMVDYYGTPTALKQIAAVATPQADLIVIKPFDPASIKDIERAIKSSDLSLAPITDSKVIRLSIPPLSEERRTQIVQQVKQMGEKAKIGIRNIRRDANKRLEEEQKNKLISEDDRDKGKKDIDNLTKKYTEQTDTIIKTKSDDIMAQ
jgi:ribosome recycling factor